MTESADAARGEAIVCGGSIGRQRDAILQTLDRVIGGKYFAVDPFERSVDRWNNVAVVYAKDHPDLEAFASNPEVELARIGGRVVGVTTDAKIARAGKPRLMSKLDISDVEVNQKIDDGKISLSTGFWCPTEENILNGYTTPNHVLLFDETVTDLPKDQGSGILNKTEVIMTDSTESGLIDRLNDFLNKHTDKPVATPTVVEKLVVDTEKVAELTNKIESLQADVVSRDASIAEKDTSIAEMKNKIAAYEQERFDRDWAEIKNKCRIPAGWVDTPEKETELKREYFESPTKFFNKVVETLTASTDDKQESGVEHVNAEITSAAKVVKGTGMYDPVKKEWK